MKKTVLTPLLVLLITGCGGGDGEQEESPIAPPTETHYFEVSSLSSQGGQLTPTRLRLGEGDKIRIETPGGGGWGKWK